MQRAEQEEHAESCREQDGAQPETLGHPRRDAQAVLEDPVERPGGEQVPDVLVGDGAVGGVRLPEVRRAGQQSSGVEVEVLLGVGDDASGRRPHHRHVGDGGEQRVAEDSLSPGGPGQR